DTKNGAEVARRRAALAPPGSQSKQALFLESADLFIEANAPEAALPVLDQALAAPPSDPTGLGQVQIRRGKLLEAKDPSAAVAAYSQAWPVRELHERAVAGLERLLSVPASRVAAGAALEHPLRQLGDPRRLAQAM